jgi:hypothetical protein
LPQFTPHGLHLVSHIAQARFAELDGADHWASQAISSPFSPASGNSSAASRREAGQ